MPLFRIERRAKEVGSTPVSTVPMRESSGAPTFMVVLAGALFGLFVLVAVSAVLVVRSRPPTPTANTENQANADAAAGEVTSPDTGIVANLALDTVSGPSRVNPEFNLEDVIARVGTESIAMRNLDRAVRVARVLGNLSGDPVPVAGDPALRDFQIQMLKRLVDVELMRQAAQTEGLLIPGGPVDTAIQGYLDQVGATQTDLQVAMAAEQVSNSELERWFEDARTANFFVLNSLLVGRETESRDTVTQEWLAAEWQRRAAEIAVSFYEPTP
jgi:hypothetical protein